MPTKMTAKGASIHRNTRKDLFTSIPDDPSTVYREGDLLIVSFCSFKLRQYASRAPGFPRVHASPNLTARARRDGRGPPGDPGDQLGATLRRGKPRSRAIARGPRSAGVVSLECGVRNLAGPRSVRKLELQMALRGR
jgi:hypothetical protein